MSPFRYIILGILFILWVAFSYGIYTIMNNQGFTEWWQILIPLCFLWLVYVIIVRAVYGD